MQLMVGGAGYGAERLAPPAGNSAHATFAEGHIRRRDDATHDRIERSSRGGVPHPSLIGGRCDPERGHQCAVLRAEGAKSEPRFARGGLCAGGAASGCFQITGPSQLARCGAELRGGDRSPLRRFEAHGRFRKRPSMLSGPGPLATSNRNPPAIEMFLRKLII
jgi:hypothetical protein